MEGIEQYYTLFEVSGWTHLPTPFLRKSVREGHLKASCFEGKYYVTLADLKVFLNNGAGKYSKRGRPRKS